jgi:hypothetical protein
MKKLCFIFLASTTFALLPPLAQSTREIQSLLSDSRFYKALGSAEVIKEIARTDNGYLILTQNYALQVDIHYLQNENKKLMGPAQFEFEFYPAVDVRTGEVKALSTPEELEIGQ